MPDTPGGVRESLTAQEVFPRPLPAQAHQFQLGQLPERLLRRKMGPRGKLVYMHRGPIVQKSEQALAQLVGTDGRLVLGRWRRRRCVCGRLPPELRAEVVRIGDFAREALAEQHPGPF